VNARKSVHKTAQSSSADLAEDERHENREKGSLSKKDYDELVALWTKKGAANWFRERKKTGLDWRRQVVADLTTQAEKWREMIKFQTGSPLTVEHLLEKAGGNPLMFLNLAGVSPYRVLRELESLHDETEAMNSVRLRSQRLSKMDIVLFEKATQRALDHDKASGVLAVSAAAGLEAMVKLLLNSTDRSSSTSDIALFRKTARRVKPYERALKVDIYSAHGRSPVATAERLKTIITLIKNPRASGLIPPWTPEKSTPTKDELWSAVASLVRLCKSRMTTQFGPRAGEQAMWAAVTAVLMCGAPGIVQSHRKPGAYRKKSAGKKKRAESEEEKKISQFVRSIKDGYRVWSKHPRDELPNEAG